MEPQAQTFDQIFTLARAFQWLIAALFFFTGILIARAARKGIQRAGEHRLGAQRALIAGRAVSTLILVITLVTTLNQAGIDLSIALGTAGIFTVAIGFASQTSASNLISGLFLMGEKPFVIGDTIQVGETQGVVISIDLLSAKLRTFDNLLVRIPNEFLLKSEITNLTAFSKRRLDLMLDVDYTSDLDKVKTVLFELAEKNPLCLEDPAPVLIFNGFGESALNLRFSSWTETANHLDLKTSLNSEIKVAFEREGIFFPFPQRTLSQNGPLEVKIIGSEPKVFESEPKITESEPKITESAPQIAPT